MSKHKNCNPDCCHQMECCPRGLFEHIQHYRYLRWATIETGRITFREYWWHEIKILLRLDKSDSGLIDLERNDD